MDGMDIIPSHYVKAIIINKIWQELMLKNILKQLLVRLIMPLIELATDSEF